MKRRAQEIHKIKGSTPATKQNDKRCPSSQKRVDRIEPDSTVADAVARYATHKAGQMSNLQFDPEIRNLALKSQGFEEAQQAAAMASAPYRKALDDFIAKHQSGLPSNSPEAAEFDALRWAIQDAETRAYEVRGFRTATPEPIDTPAKLEADVRFRLTVSRRAARAYGVAYETRDFTADNSDVWDVARAIYASYPFLSAPPHPDPITETHYLERLHQWCLTAIIELKRELGPVLSREEFAAQIAVCTDAIGQYVSLRCELFRLLVLRSTMPGGPWRIQYKRKATVTTVDAPVVVTHDVAVACELNGRPIDGLVEARIVEAYVPFHDFTLLNKSDRKPRKGSAAHDLQVRLQLVLDRLLKTVKELARSLDAVVQEAERNSHSTDANALARLLFALPVFPYWPKLKSDGAFYDAVLAGEKPLLDEARLALQRLERSSLHDIGDDEYQPARWFKKGAAATLRMASRPNRKTKRVRSKLIGGVKCYLVADVRRWYPGRMPDAK